MMSLEACMETLPRDPGDGPVHVAVVQSGGRICQLVADTSRDGLTRQLAEYVRDAARYQLSPCDSERVDRFLADGRLEEAVALYFGSTGERWAREELLVRAVQLPAERIPREEPAGRHGGDRARI